MARTGRTRRDGSGVPADLESSAHGPPTVPAPQLQAVLALQRSAGNRAVTAVVQRRVTNSPTQSVTVFDLAQKLLSGEELGITPVVVNGTEMPVDHGMRDAVRDALHHPTITTGPGAQAGTQEARVTSVADNSVGATMKLPHQPPSTRNTDTVRAYNLLGLNGTTAPPITTWWWPESASPAMLGRLDQATQVTVEGDPSDAGFLAAVTAHERRHAQDHWTLAGPVLTEWETQLADPQHVGVGSSAVEATNDLYRRAGGTPEEIATELDTGWNNLSKAFHTTREGRKSDLQRYWISKDAAKIIVHWGYGPGAVG